MSWSVGIMKFPIHGKPVNNTGKIDLLANVYITMENHHVYIVGKTHVISMAILNGSVKLPEGLWKPMEDISMADTDTQ